MSFKEEMDAGALYSKSLEIYMIFFLLFLEKKTMSQLFLSIHRSGVDPTDFHCMDKNIFKTSSFMFHRREFVQVWNDMRVIKRLEKKETIFFG